MGRIPDHLLRLAQRVAEGRWVTIGAKADPKRPGKKKGGTPVELDGEGKITKGPAALTGKRPSELKKAPLTPKGQAGPAAPPKVEEPEKEKKASPATSGTNKDDAETAATQKKNDLSDEARKHVDAAIKAGDADEYWDENQDDPKFTKAFNHSKQQFLQAVNDAEADSKQTKKNEPQPVAPPELEKKKPAQVEPKQEPETSQPPAPPVPEPVAKPDETPKEAPSTDAPAETPKEIPQEPAAPPPVEDLAKPEPAAKPDADKIAKIETEPTTPAAAASIPKPGEDPRQTAKRVDKAMDADYIYARVSEVGNFGRDVANSARHRLNAWRGLADAEQNGNAEKMVTRDNLMKVEPPTLSATSQPETALAHLAAHLAIIAMPPKPYDEKDYANYARSIRTSNSRRPEGDKITPLSPEQLRQRYYEAYREIKAEAESLSKSTADPVAIVVGLRNKVSDILTKSRRGQDGENSKSQIYAHYWNPVAEAMRKYHNKLHGKSSPVQKLNEFANLFAEKYGLNEVKSLLTGKGEAEKHMENLNQHAIDIMEGQSFSQSFGTKKDGDGKKAFDPTEAYVTSNASRVGGRNVKVDSPEAGKALMMDKLGLSGVQWGNSVTDDERKHHLQKSSEALVDLADAIGADDSLISLGGKLALSIGARGSGKAMAHYEPDEMVMNLTRKSGVGSLAHEWGHALDHYLAGQKKPNFANRANSLFQSDIQNMRIDPTESDPVSTAIHGVMTAVRKSGFRERLIKELTEMQKQGYKISFDYWTRGHEMFARSFERHIQKKMKDNGQENTYLVALRKEGHALWPNDNEMSAIGSAFEKLFEALRQRHPRKQNAAESRRSRANHFARKIFREAI